MITSERDRKFAANTGLVWEVLHRCFRSQIQTNVAEEEDLFVEGCIGLLKAIDRFEEGKGYRFSSFAFPFIWGTIRHYLRDYCQPGGIKMRRVDIEAGIYAQVVSLEIGDIEKLGGLSEYSRQQASSRYDDEDWLAECTNLLPEREKTIISMLLAGCTQIEIAERIGVSEGTVGRDKTKAIQRFKEWAKSS